MGKLYTGSINLSKLDKKRLFTSEKTKEVWLNVSIWLNDEVDKYGNIAGIQQSTKKDEEKIYIGNLKEYKKTDATNSAKPNIEQKQNNDTPQPDDLPF